MCKAACMNGCSKKGEYHQATAGEKDPALVMLRVQITKKLHERRARARGTAIYLHASVQTIDN